MRPGGIGCAEGRPGSGCVGTLTAGAAPRLYRPCLSPLGMPTNLLPPHRTPPALPQSCNNRVVHRSNYFLRYTEDSRDFRYQVGRGGRAQQPAAPRVGWAAVCPSDLPPAADGWPPWHGMERPAGCVAAPMRVPLRCSEGRANSHAEHQPHPSLTCRSLLRPPAGLRPGLCSWARLPSSRLCPRPGCTRCSRRCCRRRARWAWGGDGASCRGLGGRPCLLAWHGMSLIRSKRAAWKLWWVRVVGGRTGGSFLSWHSSTHALPSRPLHPGITQGCAPQLRPHLPSPLPCRARPAKLCSTASSRTGCWPGARSPRGRRLC